MNRIASRARSIAWLVLPLCLPGAATIARAEGPKLVNERKLFGPEEPYESGGRGYGLGFIRLSPDGKSVLCIRRQVLPGAGGGPGSEVSRLVLREVETGKDRVLPVPPWNWEEGLVRMVSRNLFDPTGRMLVLAGGTATNAAGVFEIGSAKVQALVYMLADGRTRKVAAAEEMVLPQFDRTGRRLIIMTAERTSGQLFRLSLDDWQLEKLSIWGMPMPPSPTEDLLPLFFRDRDEGRLKFAVYDVQADKELTSLPVHASNTLLDEIPSQWSPDGQYLYYTDLADPPGGKGPSKMVTRIWDRDAGKSAGPLSGMLDAVEEAFPVGPGPTPTTMVLAQMVREKLPPALVLHDAATGKTWKLADAPVRVFCAGGGKVVYSRSTEGRMYTTFVADILAPVELASRPVRVLPEPTSQPRPIAPAPAPSTTRPAPPTTSGPATPPAPVRPPAPVPATRPAAPPRLRPTTLPATTPPVAPPPKTTPPPATQPVQRPTTRPPASTPSVYQQLEREFGIEKTDKVVP